MSLSTKAKTWTGFGIVMVLILLLVGALALPALKPKLGEKVVRALEERFNGKAEVQDIELSLFPQMRAIGKKLVLRYQGRTDLPPLISIEEFSLSAGWLGLLRSPMQITQVTLNGLVITIPPKEDKNPDQQQKDQQQEASQTSGKVVKQSKESYPFVVGRVHADGTILRILPKRLDKEPLLFELYRLKLHSVGLDHPMEYEATLKNATPPGLINTKGEFGPWHEKDPGSTPVSGKYTFRNADLSVFKGISGKLFSIGQFNGTLERIEVAGTTETPDFTVRTGNNPVPLKTEFQAVVDGTSGDTLLQPVNASFGKTLVVCHGGIVGLKGRKGKAIKLDVKVDKGRIEDLLKLVAPSAPLIGGIRFTAKFDLPPGDAEVVKKLNLDGSFSVDNAEFTTNTVQEKIEKLSLRTRGRHEDSTEERIVSDMSGKFKLRNGTITFSHLSFAVPGAKIQLQGDYGLITEKIDFRGTIEMQAKLSQTQTGIKSILLRIVDPFFKKGKAGAVLPIKVTGTRKDPAFGLNLKGSSKEGE
jgi:AsmA-like C-terminal region